MDFCVDPSDIAFRDEVRAFVKEHLPLDMAFRGQQGFLAGDDDSQRWTRILHETRGWSVPHWPVADGGTGWTAMQRYIFEEECYLAGAPTQNQAGVSLVGPVICEFGDEEQKRRFLPPIQRGAGGNGWAQFLACGKRHRGRTNRARTVARTLCHVWRVSGVAHHALRGRRAARNAARQHCLRRGRLCGRV